MMKVVMPGGSGHVGQMIRRLMEPQGWQFTVLTRKPGKPDEMAWDAKTLGPWQSEIDGADIVLNLAGRSVDCRYTQANLKEMLDSRVDSTRVVGEAIAQAKLPPKLWLQASTATIYAHRFDQPNGDDGILGGGEPNAPNKWKVSIEIAKAWEQELDRANTPRTRKVALRSSMIMSIEAGSVFDVLARLAKRGLGGPAASGRQYVSWIHELDFVRALQFLIDHEEFSGPVNVCSPNPLPNREFMAILRQAVGARFSFPLPALLLEIGAVLRRTDTELILKSRRVVPSRLLGAGFTFEFPTWPEAAKDLAKHRFGIR
ncbi:MAG TPA: DUF1731 domain-containing protein [Fimbriimonadaceae bacterium]|nr:DUF1731 domain-containing protein [Fimbriimonadaceae bacterium]